MKGSTYLFFFFLGALVLVISDFVGLVIHTRNGLPPRKKERGEGKLLNDTIITFIYVFKKKTVKNLNKFFDFIYNIKT